MSRSRCWRKKACVPFDSLSLAQPKLTIAERETTSETPTGPRAKHCRPSRPLVWPPFACHVSCLPVSGVPAASTPPPVAAATRAALTPTVIGRRQLMKGQEQARLSALAAAHRCVFKLVFCSHPKAEVKRTNLCQSLPSRAHFIFHAGR